LTVVIDATYSIGDEISGIGVYSREIIARLAERLADQTVLLAYRPHRVLRALRTPVPPRCKRRILWDTRRVRGADLIHGLNQRLPEVRYPLAVSTFHDLFVLTGDYSTAEFRTRFTKQAREAAARSDRIIAVSHFTAGLVIELLGVERSRVTVIPHGVRPRPPDVKPARERLILHVGAIQKRKNLVRLVKAFERLPSDWRLVLAGGSGYGAGDVLAAIASSPARGRIGVPGYLDAAALEDLYARASLLGFPSLDEGFGIPILEAMAWGVPVLTSRRSALPEVAGDAALYADPLNLEEIAGQLRRLTDDEHLRASLAEAGRRRAAQFSWERTAAATVGLYQELLGG
jgi:glycosyltransferase involved in cell wall biosynthesis